MGRELKDWAAEREASTSGIYKKWIYNAPFWAGIEVLLYKIDQEDARRMRDRLKVYQYRSTRSPDNFVDKRNKTWTPCDTWLTQRDTVTIGKGRQRLSKFSSSSRKNIWRRNLSDTLPLSGNTEVDMVQVNRRWCTRTTVSHHPGSSKSRKNAWGDEKFWYSLQPSSLTHSRKATGLEDFI